jgi:hypothetical protein
MRSSFFKISCNFDKVSTGKIKIRSGQNVTAMGWPKLQWVEMSQCDDRSLFGWTNNPSTLSRNVTVENCHRVRMSQQKNVTWPKCYSRKLSHGRSVIVGNCHTVRMSQWTKYFVDIWCGSECRVVGLREDVTSRHRLYICYHSVQVCGHWPQDCDLLGQVFFIIQNKFVITVFWSSFGSYGRRLLWMSGSPSVFSVHISEVE